MTNFEGLLRLRDAHADMLTRCPSGWTFGMQQFQLVQFSAEPWEPLEREGLVRIKRIGTPPHTFFVTISERGERKLQEGNRDGQ